MPTGVSFSIPATDGTSGHASTQTSLFVRVPSAPATDLTIFDYDLQNTDYFRLRLTTARHLVLEYQYTGYGSATADLGVLAVATWTWVSCGFTTSGGLHIRGDVTPSGGATATTTVLAASGSATGTTQTAIPFGVGVTLTSIYGAFPNNDAAGWLCSKLIQNQIASNAAAGNPEPVPSTDFAPSAEYREYLAHDPLGTALTLTDSGTAGIDLLAGAQGLTIVNDGPALLPSSPGPGGAHEGDLSVYQGGQWTTLHVDTDGQLLALASGQPAWSTPDQTQIAVDATEAATNDSLSGGDLRTNLRRIRYQLAQLGTGAWNTLRAMVQLSPSSQQTGTINVSGEVQGSDFKPGGLTGATAVSRYVGATTSGAPVSGTFAVGDFVVDRSGQIWICTTAGTPGTWTQVSGSGGSVTSVGLTMPAEFSVSGSPVTGSGTLAVTKANESANTVFGGPTSGGAAAPTFRALVSADLPSAPTVSGEVTASDFKPSGLTGATAASRLVGATASGAPASGTFAVGDVVVDQSGTFYICTVAGTPGTWVQVKGNPTFSGEVTASDFKPSGLTGATAAVRFVGGTASAAPTTGTFAVGDFVITQAGSIFICTTAGTPGTWTQVSGGGGGGSSTLAGDTDVSIASPVGGQVLGYSSALSKWVNQNQAGVAATTQTAQLGADVTLTNANTYYDGPSVTLAPGTWLLVGAAIVNHATLSGVGLTIKLWDGTTTYASADLILPGTNYQQTLPVSAVVVLTSTTTLKISAACTSAGGVVYAAATYNGAGNNATYLRAIQLSGNPVGQQAPAVRCYNSAAQSLANASFVTLTFDTNRVDQGASTPQHSTSSNTSRLVCQQAGLYQITANVQFASNATGQRALAFLLNGSTYIAQDERQAANGDTTLIALTTLYQLAVGDYIEVQAYQNSGGALNSQANANQSPEFMMARIDSGPGAVQPNTKVQLDYTTPTTSDIFSGTSLSSGWNDVIANQAFSVDDANSVVDVSASGNMLVGGAGGATIATRFVVDSAGTAINKLLGGGPCNTTGYPNPFAGADTVSLTGLSAGSHTIKVQVYVPSTGFSAYLRPNAQPNSEFVSIRVLERKQSVSPPSSTPAPAVRARNSAAVSIPNAAYTAVTLNTTDLDQGTSVAQHSTSTNTSRLTCQQAGTYIITGVAQYSNSSGGSRRILSVWLNGTTSIVEAEGGTSGGGTAFTSPVPTVLYYLNVGDYVELKAYQDSGGALNINSAALMMARVDSGGQGFVPIPMVKTANATIAASESMVVAGANSLTLTLPAASSRAPGMPIVVKNDNFTGTTIARNGTDTIDGATTYSLSSAYQSVTLVGDGIGVWRAI